MRVHAVSCRGATQRTAQCLDAFVSEELPVAARLHSVPGAILVLDRKQATSLDVARNHAGQLPSLLGREHVHVEVAQGVDDLFSYDVCPQRDRDHDPADETRSGA